MSYEKNVSWDFNLPWDICLQTSACLCNLASCSRKFVLQKHFDEPWDSGMGGFSVPRAGGGMGKGGVTLADAGKLALTFPSFQGRM